MEDDDVDHAINFDSVTPARKPFSLRVDNNQIPNLESLLPLVLAAEALPFVLFF
jgi:hypothetical protein